MWKTTRILFVVAFAVLLATGVGCTRNRKIRTRASGTVTVDGHPAKVGRITFTQVGGGKSYSDTITNGRYGVRSRYPMTPGEYDVRIECSSTGSSRGGYDRHWTERVSVGGFVSTHRDFHLR